MMLTDLFSIGNTSDKLSAVKKYQTGQEGLLAAIGSGNDDPESQQIDFLAMLSGIDADNSPAVQQQVETAGPTDTGGRLTEEFGADDALTEKPRENSGKDREIAKRSLSGSQATLASLMGWLTMQPVKPETSDNIVSGAGDDGNEVDDGSGGAVGKTGIGKSANPPVATMIGPPAGNMPHLPDSKATEGYAPLQAESAMTMQTKTIIPEALPKSMRRGQPAMDSYSSERSPGLSDLVSSSKVSDPAGISARSMAGGRNDPQPIDISSTIMPGNAAEILTDQENASGRPAGLGVSLPKTDDGAVSGSVPPVFKGVQIPEEQENRSGASDKLPSDDFQSEGAMKNVIGMEGGKVLRDPASPPVLETDLEEQAASRAGRGPAESVVPAAADGSIKAEAASLIQGRFQGLENEALQGKNPLKRPAAVLSGLPANEEAVDRTENLITTSDRPDSPLGIGSTPLSSGSKNASGDPLMQTVRAAPKSGVIPDSGLAGKNRMPLFSKTEVRHWPGNHPDGSMAVQELKTRGPSNEKGVPHPVVHQSQGNSGSDQKDAAAISVAPPEKGHVADKFRMDPIKSDSGNSVDNTIETGGMNSGASGDPGSGAGSGPGLYTAASVPLPGKIIKNKDDDLFQMPESKTMPPILHFAGEAQNENTPAVNGPSKESLPESQSFQTELLNRIVEKTSATIQSGQSEIRIDIKPESLGHLRLQVSSDNQQMTVKILAENSHVKQMIESHAPVIKNELLQQGIHVHAVKVDLLMSGGSDFAYSQNEGAAYKQQRRQEPAYKGGKKTTVGGGGSLSGPVAANHAIGTGSGRVNYFA